MKADYLATLDQLREEALRFSDHALVAQQIFLMGIITGLEDLADEMRTAVKPRSYQDQARWMIRQTRKCLQVYNEIAQHRGLKLELER